MVARLQLLQRRHDRLTPPHHLLAAHGTGTAATETSAGSGAIGSPCKTATDCSDGTCLTGNLWVNGYCAKTIAECPAPGSKLEVCPNGAACVAAILSGAGESKPSENPPPPRGHGPDHARGHPDH